MCLVLPLAARRLLINRPLPILRLNNLTSSFIQHLSGQCHGRTFYLASLSPSLVPLFSHPNSRHSKPLAQTQARHVHLPGSRPPRSHNLSARFKLLEAATKGLDPANVIQDEVLSDAGEPNARSVMKSTIPMFQGVVIPRKPDPPASDDCCMSSCAVCVYDLYATSLEEYDHQLASARETLTQSGIPHAEWPEGFWSEEEYNAEGVAGGKGEDRRAKARAADPDFTEARANVIVKAFIEFERSKREKGRAQKKKQDK